MLNFNEASLPEVRPHGWLDDYYQVGEWSFDLEAYPDGDGSPEKALEAAKAWAAWYLFLTKREAVKNAHS